ncbi:hypothetical protein QVZ41_10260 [Wenyingzhuangia sp. chi5]|uniref:Lipoprotein n=1 Tax=Wenyingzhuangia gilva TaxID=3057677 RepID=A0ABT8VTC1_9FLAO|nr:hypothetical protein [Wenyingzhuangia sp. chi5]MDO3695227.1 hypothetical protein [Wenyingzhuangia sp. chi5]
MKKILLTLSISLFMISCSTRLHDFTLISTKNIELNQLTNLKKSEKRVSDEDKTHIIILIPTKQAKIENVIDKIIENSPGCIALLDVVIYSKFWYIPYVYGQQKFVVEATPLINGDYNSITSNLPNYGKVYLSKKGEIEKMVSISENEFNTEKDLILK